MSTHHLAQLNIGAIRPYGHHSLMAINVSVWESLEALQHFVYSDAELAPRLAVLP